MRVIVDKIEQPHVPLYRLYIHHAPHRRMHHKIIAQYRAVLVKAFEKAGVELPINTPIDISPMFINPSSPDLDNLLSALFRALDGKTLRGHPAVLTDDGLIDVVHRLSKMYT